MILDKIMEYATGMQRPNELWDPPFAVTLTPGETGKVEPMGFATRREYKLTASFVATYWANDAQKQEAREVAERALIHAVYGDVLAMLGQIEHAVMDGDGRRAFAVCGELRQLVTG